MYERILYKLLLSFVLFWMSIFNINVYEMKCFRRNRKRERERKCIFSVSDCFDRKLQARNLKRSKSGQTKGTLFRLSLFNRKEESFLWKQRDKTADIIEDLSWTSLVRARHSSTKCLFLRKSVGDSNTKVETFFILLFSFFHFLSLLFFFISFFQFHETNNSSSISLFSRVTIFSVESNRL